MLLVYFKKRNINDVITHLFQLVALITVEIGRRPARNINRFDFNQDNIFEIKFLRSIIYIYISWLSLFDNSDWLNLY